MSGGEKDLLQRILPDAERLAADGYFREGVLLLRWAARIATRERLPLVLLSYHRILGDERARGARAQARVELDNQPAPLPQFPEVVPAVERNAFVPVPEGARSARKAVVVDLPPHRRRAGHTGGWVALIGACGALALMLQPDGLPGVRWGAPHATAGHSHAESHEASGLLLTWAQESLVSGDSIRARAHLRRVLEDPRTSVAEYAVAARFLIGLDAAAP
jgi:hypothetical protein